jgi:tetratricopeptide (TPR) repeat protein
MRYFIHSLLLIAFLPILNAQVFIPIIIPTGPTVSNSWECGTSNPQAKEYIYKGKENFNTNLNASLVYFQGAIKVDSMFCDAYDFVAIIFIKKENYDSAMKYIDASLAVNTANMWARNTKGRLHLTMKEYEKATDYFFTQHTRQPDEGLWLYYLAESLFERDMLDSAKNITLKMQMTVQKQNPDLEVPIGYYIQGISPDVIKENAIAQTTLPYVKSDFYKDAVSNYYDGINYEIATQLSMYLQGKIFCKMTEYETAQRALLKVKDNFKKGAEYNYYLGLTFLYGVKPNQKKARKYIVRAFKKGAAVPAEIKNNLNLNEI